MRVAIFLTKENFGGFYVAEAFAAGVRACGDTPFFISRGEDVEAALHDFDVGVQVGFGKVRTGAREKFRSMVPRLVSENGKRLITIETGFFDSQTEWILRERVATGRMNLENEAIWARMRSSAYFAVGYDGFKGGADYCNADASADRWEKLGRQLVAWRRAGDYILVTGQPRSLSDNVVDPVAWYGDKMTQIAAVSERPFLFRHHPRGYNRLEPLLQRLPSDVLRRLTFSQSALLVDDLPGAYAAVVLTSNAAAAIAVAGIPVFTDDPQCIAYPVANYDFSQIESPKFPERLEWVHKLAYAQWTIAEMADGVVWRRLRSYGVSRKSRRR